MREDHDGGPSSSDGHLGLALACQTSASGSLVQQACQRNIDAVLPWRGSGLQGLSSEAMLVLAGQETHSHAANPAAHSLLQAEPVDSADHRATGQIRAFEVDAGEQGQRPGALDEGAAMGGVQENSLIGVSIGYFEEVNGIAIGNARFAASLSGPAIVEEHVV